MSQLLRSPDIILFTFFNMITEDVSIDLNKSIQEGDEKKSWLYKLLGNYRIQRYSFFEQSKDVFLRKEGDEKKIFIDITYNKKKNGPTNLFLSLGNENYSSNNISVDESVSYESGDESFVSTFSRRFDRVMSLYIYCQNSNETILLYEVYKSLIITYTQHLEMLGLRNITVSGQDISEYPDFLPKDFFFRVLTIKFNYETLAYDLEVKNFIDCFNFNGIPIKE